MVNFTRKHGYSFVITGAFVSGHTYSRIIHVSSMFTCTAINWDKFDVACNIRFTQWSASRFTWANFIAIIQGSGTWSSVFGLKEEKEIIVIYMVYWLPVDPKFPKFADKADKAKRRKQEYNTEKVNNNIYSTQPHLCWKQKKGTKHIPFRITLSV